MRWATFPVSSRWSSSMTRPLRFDFLPAAGQQRALWFSGQYNSSQGLLHCILTNQQAWHIAAQPLLLPVRFSSVLGALRSRKY